MFTFDYLNSLIVNKQTYRAQLDNIQTKVDRRMAQLSITALSTPLFPDKKNPEIKLCASNDTERKIALDNVIAFDEYLVKFAVDLQETKRAYMASCEQYECVVLLMKLETAKLSNGG